jgi:hypothetical protein
MPTARARHRFTVKEGPGNEPFIAFEPTGEADPAFYDGMLTFDLREGIDIKRAHEIAKMLNDSVTSTALIT